MAVLNWEVVVVPVIVRNSVPFCRTRPVPVRPATVTPMAWVPVVHVTTTVVTVAVAVPLPVPPIVNEPAPPPPPPVPPLPELAGGPLQAASASEIRTIGAKRENFTRDFMAIDCSFDTLL